MYRSELCRVRCSRNKHWLGAKISIGRQIIMKHASFAFRSNQPISQLFGVGRAIPGIANNYDGDIKCPNGTNPIGFGARSSCYSLVDFKVKILPFLLAEGCRCIIDRSIAALTMFKQKSPFHRSVRSDGLAKNTAACLTILPSPWITANLKLCHTIRLLKWASQFPFHIPWGSTQIVCHWNVASTSFTVSLVIDTPVAYEMWFVL